MATVGGIVYKVDVDGVLATLNSARTRYGLASTTLTNLGIGNLISSAHISTMKTGLDQIIATVGATGSIITTDIVDYGVGGTVKANLLNLISTKSTAAYNFCSCNCDRCSCDCDRCTCNCDRCPCNCDDWCCDYCTDDAGADDKFCLLPDQLLFTNNGVKKVQDIKEGDFILTHTGEYKKVLVNWGRDFNSKIYGIHSEGNNVVWTTKEHELYVDENGNKKFIRADEINKTYNALLPIVKTNNYINKDNLIYIKNDMKFEVDFIKLIAYLITRGSYIKSNDEIIGFNINIKDCSKECVKNIKNLVEKIFNANIILTKEEVITFFGDKLIVNVPINMLLRSLLGDDLNKLPIWICELSEDKLNILINTIEDSVGKLLLPNETLAYQIKMILAKLGYISTVELTGRYVIKYTVKYSKVSKDSDYIYIPIEEVEIKDYNGKVYNMIVDENNTYVSDIILRDANMTSLF